MNLLVDEVKKRRDELEKIIERKRKEYDRLSSKLPKGMIRTAQHGDVFQYYFREEPGDKSGTYIPRRKEKTVAEYAHMEYCEKIVKSAEKELAALNRLIGFYENNTSPEGIFERMSLGKRILVNPIRISDEEYTDRWLRENKGVHEFREEGKIFETSFGERVRSKSEVLIAELYHRKGIPYIYEKQLEFEGYVTLRPDFTILDVRRRVEIYHEHLGLIDEEEYRNNAIHKIHLYEKNGIFLGDRLMVSVETKKNPIDIRIVDKQISHILYNTN